ncbi:electron transport complex subunit RsxC [Rhodothalassium salexigens]|uniref:electron transport complex subunit RsxC n=1 Tax=Rhodothalassium salexigens TaxID=1086 RepID=UPI0019122EBE|nr:electron transport complex subunit RsxC [Rhodothalassium salexigens]MBK5911809.1 electron transport complex subunit RsxC [Rhodothalassium salexigens]
MSPVPLFGRFDPARLFSFKGGVHPETRKHLSAERAIEDMPLPALLRVPLLQHVGAEAEPLVARGDTVLKGQLIGQASGPISANVHAPTSGRVVAVGPFPAPHPSGLPVTTVTIRPDGADRWGPRLAKPHVATAAPETLAAQVAEAGIVGMGGATFPAAVKLTLRARYDLHTLIINAAECEPYLTCDDRLMRERADEVADGAGIMARALGVRRVIVAIESNKPLAIEAMTRHRHVLDHVLQIKTVPTQYPMGSEKHLVKTLTGKETPARALTAEMGVVVHNAATAHAVHLALRYGEPLISRVVTVSGRGVARPANVRVPIGTPVADVLAHCGGLVATPERLLLGGPMMGQPIQSPRVPVIKGTNGVLALTAAEAREQRVMPCIRCGLCVQVCPMGLTPFELKARIDAGDLDGAAKVGLLDCLQCGCCSFACPSNRPLVQTIQYAKGKLTERDSARHQRAEAKRLAAARTARLAAIAEAKRAAMARRKAEMAAKKKPAGQSSPEPAAKAPTPAAPSADAPKAPPAGAEPDAKGRAQRGTPANAKAGAQVEAKVEAKATARADAGEAVE